MRVGFCKPCIDEKDIKGVVKVLESGWLAMGKKVELFEKQFARYIGCRFAVSVNSCTSALFLSLKELNLKEGDEVITSTLTFASTVNVILHCGLKPVLVDVDDTGCINPSLIEKVVTERTKAIIPVHYGGNVCNMYKINKIASKYGLKVIEDAAHAVGASYNDKWKVGSFPPNPMSSNTVCFSFYPTKNMTTGEGGMICTNDDFIAGRLMLLRMHGMDRDAWKRFSHKGKWDYDVLVNGYKMNMTDLNASLGITQLQKLDKMNHARRKIAMYYNGWLDYKTKTIKSTRGKVWHLYPIFVKERDKVMSKLNEAGIGTSVFFRPIHLHKAFKSSGYKKGSFPKAEYFYEHMIALPIYPDLKIKEVKYVCSQVNKLVI